MMETHSLVGPFVLFEEDDEEAMFLEIAMMSCGV